MQRRMVLFSAVLCGLATGGPLPYDESADAKAELRQALATASRARVPVLIVFGANWCEDCRALDAALKSSRNAAFLARSFQLVKVDVGRFDRNLDVAQSYGNPIRKGIPAAVVLSPNNEVLYATHAGELADARRMSENGIFEFFESAARRSPARD